MDGSESSTKRNFQTLHEQFQQMKKCQKIETSNENNDSAVETFKVIKNLIEQMIETIDGMIVLGSPTYLRVLAMKATLFYERSKLMINLGKEKAAEELLIVALDIVKDFILKSEITFLAFRIINYYAYLLSKRGDYDKSKEVLELGESTYKSLKNKCSVIRFHTSDDLFSPDHVTPPSTDLSNKLERLVTNNLQMLGFIYNKQELHDKFAEYHHEVLRRQLEMRDGDVTMWALKSARLGSYFLSKDRFKEARHHLTAAIYVLYGYEKELKSIEQSDNMMEKWGELQHRFADIAKCWVKYGLSLFSVSKTNIVSLSCAEPNQILEKLWTSPFKFNNECKPTTSKIIPVKDVKSFEKNSEVTPSEGYGDTAYKSSQIHFDAANTKASDNLPNSLEHTQPNVATAISQKPNVKEYQGPFLLFPSLNITEYEDQVTASFVETTTQARALFLYTHSWLKRAKVFYTLRDHPMEYINAILDLSELYRYLAFYEENIESQYAVQKLRADALETLSTVLKEVRPQCYMAVSIELLRELAEVQLEMMGLNLRRIYVAQENMPETSDSTVHKMEALADIHSRLEQFGDNLGHNVDPLESDLMPVSDMAGDVFQYVST